MSVSKLNFLGPFTDQEVLPAVSGHTQSAVFIASGEPQAHGDTPFPFTHKISAAYEPVRLVINIGTG